MDKTERTRTEETEQTLAQAGREILQLARSELYLRMRFMDVALGSFVFLPDGQTVPAGTDGMPFIMRRSAWAGCSGETGTGSTGCVCTWYCTASSGICFPGREEKRDSGTWPAT